MSRCAITYYNRGGAQCVLEPGHPPPHLYRCAGQYCPGLPYPASIQAHPPTCGWPKVSAPAEGLVCRVYEHRAAP